MIVIIIETVWYLIKPLLLFLLEMAVGLGVLGFIIVKVSDAISAKESNLLDENYNRMKDEIIALYNMYKPEKWSSSYKNVICDLIKYIFYYDRKLKKSYLSVSVDHSGRKVVFEEINGTFYEIESKKHYFNYIEDEMAYRRKRQSEWNKQADALIFVLITRGDESEIYKYNYKYRKKYEFLSKLGSIESYFSEDDMERFSNAHKR